MLMHVQMPRYTARPYECALGHHDGLAEWLSGGAGCTDSVQNYKALSLLQTVCAYLVQKAISVVRTAPSGVDLEVCSQGHIATEPHLAEVPHGGFSPLSDKLCLSGLVLCCCGMRVRTPLALVPDR